MLIDASQKDVIRVAMIQDNSLVDYESEKILLDSIEIFYDKLGITVEEGERSKIQKRSKIQRR